MIKKDKIRSVISNILLFLLLFTLISYAGKRMNERILLQKDSYIHELNPVFLEYIHTAQHQLQMVKNIAYLKDKNYNYIETQLTLLQNNLAFIEEEYRKNSPSLALLGPIGTAAIVLKEHNLTKQLHEIVHKISTILYGYIEKTNNQFDYPFFPSIEVSLRANKMLLKQLK